MRRTTLQSQPGLHTIKNIICHDGTVDSNTKRPKNTNRATQEEFCEEDTFWNVVCESRKFEDYPFQKDSLGVYDYDDLESAKEIALHYKYTPKHWRNIQIVQMRKEDEFSDE